MGIGFLLLALALAALPRPGVLHTVSTGIAKGTRAIDWMQRVFGRIILLAAASPAFAEKLSLSRGSWSLSRHRIHRMARLDTAPRS